METLKIYLIAFCIVCCCFSGCRIEKKASEALPENAVLVVNGAVITEDDVYLAAAGAHGETVKPEDRTRTIEELLDQELLYQQGLKLRLDRDRKYRDLVAKIETQLKSFKRAEMARRVMSTRIAATVNVSIDEARQYFRLHERQITTDLHLAILRFTDEAAAAQAFARLQQGSSFESVAQENTFLVAKTGTAPWDAGYLRWDQIPEEWTDAVYALGKGQVSGVLTSKRNGTCVIKVLDARKNKDATYDRMGAIIMNRLRDQRVLEAYDRYLENLRKQAKIEKMDERRNAS